MTGGGDIPVPTPIVAHDLIFITNAHGGESPVYAVKPTATGDITLAGGETQNEHIAWSAPRDGAYMQTPIVYGDAPLRLQGQRRADGLRRARPASGAIRQRLGDGQTGFTASPVAADGSSTTRAKKATSTC